MSSGLTPFAGVEYRTGRGRILSSLGDLLTAVQYAEHQDRRVLGGFDELGHR